MSLLPVFPTWTTVEQALLGSASLNIFDYKPEMSIRESNPSDYERALILIYFQ
jgi:hypothetical protein